MKKIIAIGISLFLFIVISSTDSWADVITLRADEWCPYNCQPNSNEPGFMVEIAEVIFKKAGHTVEYDIMPWSRAIEDARQGKINGIIAAGKDDAPDFIFPEIEQAKMYGAFYVKKGDSWQYKGLDSLKVKVLGVIKDYTYIPEIDKYINDNQKNRKLIQVASGDTALDSSIKKLLAGRIGVVIEDSNVMSQYIKKNLGADQLQVAGQLPPDDLYIAFSPSNPKSKEYAKMISEGIAELRKSGKITEILNKYGLKDWK